MERELPRGEWFSQPVHDFRGRGLSERAYPAGYAALIEHYNLATPLPPHLSAIAIRHHPVSTDEWLLLTPRYRPSDTLLGHLTYALRYEGVDLAVLVALFKAIPADAVVTLVRAQPTSSYARRIWFLYEWLLRTRLDIHDAGKVRAIEVADPDLQITSSHGIVSPRHRVVNNLPGTSAFCPMVRRTAKITAFLSEHLDERARDVIGKARADIITRAAAFLVLADSKSSFAIESERPSPARASRWSQAIAQAGDRRLSIGELERLQSVVVGDHRFVQLGLRTEGGFVGEHDRQTRAPMPEHISARPQDLRALLEGMVAYDERAEGAVDAVIIAAVVAFGFVYIHPFEDGNGRIHRWLIHHVLARAKYNPPEVVFPVSVAILREITEYRRVLESYSRALLPFVEWGETDDHNVHVLNETADYYRYFDATAHVEFLYHCVEQTVDVDLPNEVGFLEAFDRFSVEVQRIVAMPVRMIELLRTFLHQGDGVLSRRARSKEFERLTDDEVEKIERLFHESFSSLPVPKAMGAGADELH